MARLVEQRLRSFDLEDSSLVLSHHRLALPLRQSMRARHCGLLSECCVWDYRLRHMDTMRCNGQAEKMLWEFSYSIIDWNSDRWLYYDIFQSVGLNQYIDTLVTPSRLESCLLYRQYQIFYDFLIMFHSPVKWGIRHMRSPNQWSTRLKPLSYFGYIHSRVWQIRWPI